MRLRSALVAVSALLPVLLWAAPAEAAAQPVCMNNDVARRDACTLVSALVSGAVAPGMASTVTSAIATSTYKTSGTSAALTTSWKGPVSSSKLNGVVIPNSRSVTSASMYDRSGSRYFIPAAVFNRIPAGSQSAAPTYTVSISAAPIAANATSFTFTLEVQAKGNKPGVKTTDAYARFTVPLQKTFAVGAVARYCPDFNASTLQCRGGSRNGNVTLRRTAYSATGSTLTLSWSPPTQTSRHVTDTLTYTVPSNGDVRISGKTAG